MALEIEKTTKVIGKITIDEKAVKDIIVDINSKAVSTSYERMYDADTYQRHRKQMRIDERAFMDKVYEIEDAIAAESGISR